MTRDAHDEDVMTRYVLDELDATEAAAFERTLAADSDLAAEVRDLRRALAAVPYAAMTDPPGDLRARILAAAEQGGADRPATGGVDVGRRAGRRVGSDATRGQRARGAGRRRSWWPTAAAAVAAGIAVVFALDARQLRQELALQREVAELLQQPNVVVSFTLAGTGSAASAYGRVMMDMDGAKGSLAIRSMPAAPSGQVYRLWAVSAGKTVLCGQFGADPERGARAQFVVPVRAYEGPVERVFVTLEPLAETAQPTGPHVLESI